MELGTFDSWEILSLNSIVKTADKSVFEYNMSGIPQETRRFWHIENFVKGNRKPIQLLCDNNKYEATLLMDATGRTRIVWKSDFKYFLLDRYPHWKDFTKFEFPLLCFNDIDGLQYKVSFEMV